MPIGEAHIHIFELYVYNRYIMYKSNKSKWCDPYFSVIKPRAQVRNRPVVYKYIYIYITAICNDRCYIYTGCDCRLLLTCRLLVSLAGRPVSCKPSSLTRCDGHTACRVHQKMVKSCRRVRQSGYLCHVTHPIWIQITLKDYNSPGSGCRGGGGGRVLFQVYNPQMKMLYIGRAHRGTPEQPV